MDNQELLTQIAQMMEEQTKQIEEKIDQAIAKNNVAIAELLNEALEPVCQDIREIKEDATLLRADNAKNTLDIARLKMVK